MRGRKPKPTELKKLAGNPGKRPLNQNEARVERVVMYAPRELSAVAKREWRRVAGPLYEAGLLTVVDRAALAAYCQAWANWVRAERMVRQEGDVVITSNGNPVQNPWRSIANKQQEMMIKAAAEFGMTPSSRSRINVDAPEHEMSLAEMLFVDIDGSK